MNRLECALTWLLLSMPMIGRAAENPEPLAKQLLGTWRLVSTDQRLVNGSHQPSPLYGPKGVGYLYYGEAGRMCAVLMDPDRARWASEDSPTEPELRAAFDHFVAYCGTYEVNVEGGFVTHQVELDLIPNSVGSTLKRYFAFEGPDRLVLRPAPPLPKGVVEYTLTWERVRR